MTNTLYTNDNLFILNGLNSNLVDLIYLDPPFNTNKIYSAPIGSKAAGTSFKDMWTWKDVNEAYLDTLADKYPVLAKYIANVGAIHSKPMMAYLTYMAQRIIQMHRVLKDTGSIYLHCDPTASHYLKILLDEVFGKSNFRNEIVWCYTGGTDSKTTWQKKHDIILFYTKTKNYLLNPYYVPFKENTIKRFNKIDEDGKRYKINKLKSGRVTITYMKEEGKLAPDYWNIPIVNVTYQEATSYRTQKPLDLLKRIITASSNKGDIVMDPFCGCATTCVAAHQLGRKWIGIDIEPSAHLLVDRLSDETGMFKDFINTKLIPERTDITFEAPSQSVKERLYKEQKGLCNACGKGFDIWNLEIDHIIPKSKGGGDYYENYQLLCSSCNKIKGVRPMEYLRMKIKVREEMLKDKIIFGE
ncbi:MAG: HNH endonuclease [Bacteroidetes bacterium]|nr:HNH endonuclease [Bacteroidota bacterium]